MKKNGKDALDTFERRKFISVYDGYTRMTKQVGFDLDMAIRQLTGEYRGGNCTNGAMMKLLEDMDGKPVNENGHNLRDIAEQSGCGLDYSLRIDWTQQDAASDGSKATIVLPGSHQNRVETVTMDELCGMADRVNDMTDIQSMIPDESREKAEKAKSEYMRSFDSVELMEQDLHDYDNGLDSIFEDTFGSFYPFRTADIRCSIAGEFEKEMHRQEENEEAVRTAAVRGTGHADLSAESVNVLDDFCIGPQADEYEP